MRTIKIYLKTIDSKILRTDITEKGEVSALKSDKILTIPSKKNQRTPIYNKNTGKTFIKFSDQYIKWKKMTKGFWEEQYYKLYNENVSLPIRRCKVNIMFYFGDDKDKDCTNKAETIMDALVEHGILMDDNFKVVSDISLKGLLCRDRPRTEIYITILDQTDEGFNYDITDYEKHNEAKRNRRKELRSFSPTP